MHDIRTLEELSLNAWPALHTLFLGGWVVRLSDGYTRRANSVNPIYPVTGDREGLIAACEGVYNRAGLPTYFKLTEAMQPPDLDARLEAEGYTLEAPDVVIQVCDLKGFSPEIVPRVRLEDSLSEAWLDAFCRFYEIEGGKPGIIRRMLTVIQPEARFASLRVAGEIVAVGLGVVERGYIGLFDIATTPHLRRRGYGRQVVEALLAWGVESGANHSYLQVVSDNIPAVTLYESMGFKEAYRYWYRVQHR
jgi:GNAT superfamily N-acetyltransferase